ncbi:hypothetical protein AAG570_006623 [Ranatra chinensis]|uniref:Uncharacterized protein n=1 Tax=Ranatra chinensis TaxID=642074 RepID=A0ABD0YUV5_9HEMI
MASKRRNMFQKNKTQETTENGSDMASRPLSPVSSGFDAADNGTEVQSHRPTCPRSKSKIRGIGSRSALGLEEGLLHRRPWGARDPSDIRCFCFTPPKTAGLRTPRTPRAFPSDTEVRRSLQDKVQHSLRRQHASVGPATTRAQGTKRAKLVAEYTEDFCLRMSRHFGVLTDHELSEVGELIKKNLSNSGVDKRKKNTRDRTATKQPSKRADLVPVQTKRPEPPRQKQQSPTAYEVAPITAVGNTSVTGKLEKNQYVLELQTGCPGDLSFGKIIGTLNDTLIAEAPYRGDAEGAKYAVTNKSVYADLPSEYDKLTLLGIEKDTRSVPGHAYLVKRDRPQRPDDFRVMQNEHKYSLYVEGKRDRFLKRVGGTQETTYFKSTAPDRDLTLLSPLRAPFKNSPKGKRI